MSIRFNNSIYSKNKEAKPESKLNISKINTPFNIYKISKKYLNNKYGSKTKNLKYKYLGLIMENLIFNKNSHLVTVFKDYMIYDFIEELLKRYYSRKESNDRIPKFSIFYKNYLNFFCIPTIKENFSNNLIHNRFERKAEFFYKENYKNKKNNNSSEQDMGLCQDSHSSGSDEKNENSGTVIEKNLFNDTIRKKIEKYSPINTSIVLSENGSKLKKDDSGLLITCSNERSLVNIIDELDINNIDNCLNIKRNKTQSLGRKKMRKKINENKNNKVNNNILNNNINYNDSGVNDGKLFENIKLVNDNLDNSNNINIAQNYYNSNKPKKFEAQTLKILLNNNNGLLNSKSCKKFLKNNCLWKLLNDKEKISNNDFNNNIATINNNNNKNNNNQNILGANKNYKVKTKILSNIDIFKKRAIPKSGKKKFSSDEINKNLIKNKTQYNPKNTNILKNNNTNLTNNFYSNSKNGSFGKINTIKKKSNNILLSKKTINLNNNNNHNNKNQLDSILNKIQANAFNSIKKMATRKKKLILKKESKNKNITNFTRNSNYNMNMNKMGYFGLTSNCTNSNINYENMVIQNLANNENNINNDNSNIKLRSNSHKNENFYNSHSSIFDLIKKTKLKKDNFNNNNVNKVNSNLYYGNSQIEQIKNSHIQNVNININNQINIGFNHFNDLMTFSGNKKKNKIQRKIIYRNKNRNMEFNTIDQNIILSNNNFPTSFANYKKNKDNSNLFQTNKLSTLNHKNSFGSTNNVNYNRNIKLVNHYLFRSFKTINNNKI